MSTYNIEEKRQQSKLYALLPQLQGAIVEYQDEFKVTVDSIVPVLARFNSFTKAEIIQLDIKETATILP